MTSFELILGLKQFQHDTQPSTHHNLPPSFIDTLLGQLSWDLRRHLLTSLWTLQYIQPTQHNQSNTNGFIENSDFETRKAKGLKSFIFSNIEAIGPFGTEHYPDVISSESFWSTCPRLVCELVQYRYLDHITGLELMFDLGQAAWKTHLEVFTTALPRMKKLSSLSLQICEGRCSLMKSWDDEKAIILIGIFHPNVIFPNLKKLSLDGISNEVYSTHQSFCESFYQEEGLIPELPQLQTLITANAKESLLKWAENSMPSLQYLIDHGSRSYSRGFEWYIKLYSTPLVSQLRSLEFAGRSLGRRGGNSLAEKKVYHLEYITKALSTPQFIANTNLTTLKICDIFDLPNNNHFPIHLITHQSPHLSQLQSLQFDSIITDDYFEFFRALWTSPYLSNLKELGLSALSNWDERYINAIADPQHATPSSSTTSEINDTTPLALSNLESLTLDELPTRDLTPLGISPSLTQLKSLTISSFFGVGILHLMDLPIFSKLHSLSQAVCVMSLDSLQAFYSSPQINHPSYCPTNFKLTSLDLSIFERSDNNNLWTKYLFQSPRLTNLKKLSFSCYRHLDDQDLYNLAQSPFLTNLEELSIVSLKSRFTERGFYYLIESPYLNKLTSFTLGGRIELSQEALYALTLSTFYPNLKFLSLPEKRTWEFLINNSKP